MVGTELDFHKRLAILGRKHAEMAKGYVMRMRPDGLIVVHPTRPSAIRLVHLKGLFTLLLGFCVFKALMLSSIGEATYDERVARLAQGSMIERGGALIMHVDPATALIAGVLQPFTR